MMTDDRDLVTRLREYRMDVDSPDVVAEAADEIERLRDRIVATIDAVANHRSGDVVPVGAVMAALVISDRPLTEAHIRRAHEIQAILDAEK